MIKGTYTADDLIAAQRLHLRPRPVLRVVGIVLLALACVAAVAMFVGPVAADTPSVVKWALLASIAYFPILFAVLIPYRARRSFRQRKDLQRETSFAASEDGIHLQGENMQGTKPWSDYLKWKEGKRTFLVYLSDNMFHVVPKRFFDPESEVAGFRALLEQKVPRGKA